MVGEEYLISGRLELVVLPDTLQGFSIGMGNGSVSMMKSVLKTPNVLLSVCIGQSTLSVLFT
jgi:hypothetical protein